VSDLPRVGIELPGQLKKQIRSIGTQAVQKISSSRLAKVSRLVAVEGH